MDGGKVLSSQDKSLCFQYQKWYEYYNENNTTINTDNFIEYMSKHRFSQSNIRMIFEAFVEYFKIQNQSITLFNEFDGIIVVKQFEI